MRKFIIIAMMFMLVACGQTEKPFYEVIERQELTDDVMVLFSDVFQTPGVHLKEYKDNFYILLVGEEVNTGGYVLEITEAVIKDSRVSFTIEVLPPRPDEIVTEAIAYPSLILTTRELIDQVNMEIK